MTFKYFAVLQDKINACSEIYVVGDTKTQKVSTHLLTKYKIANKPVNVVDPTGEIQVKNSQQILTTLNNMINEFWEELSGLCLETTNEKKLYLNDPNNLEEIKETAQSVYEVYSSQLPLALPFINKFIKKYLSGKIATTVFTNCFIRLFILSVPPPY